MYNGGSYTVGGAANPAETAGYAGKVMGGMQQTNNFNISGSDPRAIADAVGGRLDRANADLVRDTRGAVQ